MQVTVTIPDEFAAQAQAQGLSPEHRIEQRAANQILNNQPPSPGEAAAQIRELRKGNILGGLDLKALIHEGHPY